METHESKEMYLETILRLSQNTNKVRSIDVANSLNFTRASVSVAVKHLKDEGFIEILADNSLHLTSKGLDVANSVFEKHRYLTSLLISLGVSKDIAENDACRIEHIISSETFDCIKKYVDNKD
jgi:DtxR family transcriptional regulator, Mn-dependent transcriptional regulator